MQPGNGHNLEKELQKILAGVQKPARYTGGEWNSIRKDWDSVKTKVAFAFPDVYEVGMSHLGLQILYNIVNRQPDALMERVFAPWADMESGLRERGLPLTTLESGRPVRDFDILAFTLQYEMSFTNVLNMLDLSRIPLESKLRDGNFPLVLAGGPCAFNPEPLADFIDLFAIGEGEDLFGEIIAAYQDCRGMDRDSLLKTLAGIPGVYVPRFYAPSYNADGTVREVAPLLDGVPARVRKRVVTGFDASVFPERPIVPNIEVVHDRIMLEVMRGCTRGCRFCQAGAIYRPVREKKGPTLLGQAGQLVRNTGYDEVSLTSLSTTDYSDIAGVLREMSGCLSGLGVNVSLPSLRADAFSVGLARDVQKVRRSSLTFAPEAGTQRLRDVINKGVTEQDLAEAVSSAFSAGWSAVKLYFMIGLPTETQDDLKGIAELARSVLKKGLQAGVRRGRLRITVSVSSFVPKSHTPFQWEPQDIMEELARKQFYLKSLISGERNISLKWHDARLSFLEGVLARGDRRLAPALKRAWRLGSRFDSWAECFNFNTWRQAFEESGTDPGWYAHRRYRYDQVLPWDHIESGIDREFLVREHRRAMAGQVTVDCRAGSCSGCGVCPDLGVDPEMTGEGRG